MHCESNNTSPGVEDNAESQSQAQFVTNMAIEVWKTYADHLYQNKYSALEFISVASAMSTLWAMNLKPEFCQARQLMVNATPEVLTKFGTFDQTEFAACLLSCFELTGDEMFLRVLEDIAKSAFQTKLPKDDIWLPNISQGMAEAIQFGLRLNDNTYLHYAEKIIDILKAAKKPIDGLYRPLYSRQEKKFCLFKRRTKKSYNRSTMTHSTFYRDMLRLHIQAGVTNALSLYEEGIDAELENALLGVCDGRMLVRSDASQPTFMYYRCFSFGGMFALGAQAMRDQLEATKMTDYERQHKMKQISYHSKLAERITATCHKACASTQTGLPPHRFFVKNTNRDITCNYGSGYDLSPELAESYFINWRLTHNSKYREYAWQLAQSIGAHCRSEGGLYCAVMDVNEVPTRKHRYSSPYFLGATLKYLYLTFTDDTVLPLDKWVFNEIGQPLPIQRQTKQEKGISLATTLPNIAHQFGIY